MPVHKMHPFSYILRMCLSVYLLFSLMACNHQGEEVILPQEKLSPAAKYMLDVALTNELGSNSNQRIKKWPETMRIFLSDTVSTELKEEFKLIQSEINALSESFQMVQVEDRNDANFIIFVSDGATFAAYEPNAKPYLENNNGLVWIYWDSGFNITKGSMMVDITKLSELDCQKHILREELTQALGLLNDTFDHPTSIFYQGYTCYPSYAAIDLDVLEIFLSNKIKSGMSRLEVEEALGN